LCKKNMLMLFSVLLILVFSLVFFTGCDGVEIDNDNDDAEEAAPADVQVEWTIATSWPSGILLHEMAEIWADHVEAMSGGRMVVNVEPAGAIVGGLEVLEAAHTGTIDGFHSWSGYWMGTNDAQNFFASIPMAFDTQSHIMWMYSEGLDYQNRVYQDEMNMNLVAFLCGATHPEVGAHSNVPLQELEDWIGTSYRVPGWMAQILSDMGVAVEVLAGGDVYPALETGQIDAGEFSSPIVNYTLGFHEVTDYFTGPGIHQPTCLFELTLNKDAYEALPADLQHIVEAATYMTTFETWTKDVVEGKRVLRAWQDDHGMTPVYVSDEAQLEFRQQAWNFIDNAVADDPLTVEIWESARNFYLEFIEYDEFMNPHRIIPEEYELPEERKLR